ncbi:MAG: hypothetical protein RIE73_28345 [Coleofasciculus sp. C1-SOL-03]|uniref:hypothetical protein n=1 Tax=Coleofasciculus sp. C1-SOL-03 TaxID=3069522 RepID=UPI0032F2FAB4
MPQNRSLAVDTSIRTFRTVVEIPPAECLYHKMRPNRYGDCSSGIGSFQNLILMSLFPEECTVSNGNNSAPFY